MTRAAALAGVLLTVAGCAHREPGGQLRSLAGSNAGLSAISATAGATEAVFRFDLYAWKWIVGPEPTK